jgi:hypothetical protein
VTCPGSKNTLQVERLYEKKTRECPKKTKKKIAIYVFGPFLYNPSPRFMTSPLDASYDFKRRFFDRAGTSIMTPEQNTRHWITKTVLKVCLLSCLLSAWGCGTTKWTNTSRSATEQLLLSDSMDRAVSRIECDPLIGRKIYINSSALSKVTDSTYLISALRQHFFASGCIVKDEEEEADYIVEIRAGAVGTDQNDVLYGVPATNLPGSLPWDGGLGISQLPEIALIKKTRQRAVTKIALFAYNRETGRPLWQSGIIPERSEARHWWVFGLGPIQQGEIYDETEIAGHQVWVPELYLTSEEPINSHDLSISQELVFDEEENAPPVRPRNSDLGQEPDQIAEGGAAESDNPELRVADASTPNGLPLSGPTPREPAPWDAPFLNPNVGPTPQSAPPIPPPSIPPPSNTIIPTPYANSTRPPGSAPGTTQQESWNAPQWW